MRIIDFGLLYLYMICIYKITSPTKKVYIGQTVNFQVRKLNYLRSDCRKQKRLYNSIIKYGIEKHLIHPIIECDKSELNRLERYYQDLYKSTGKNGLNIRLTTTEQRSGSFNEESRKKMSLAKLGVRRSPEVCKAISERMKIIAANRPIDFYNNFKVANKGRKHSEEHRKKNSDARKGNKYVHNFTLRKNGNISC